MNDESIQNQAHSPNQDPPNPPSAQGTTELPSANERATLDEQAQELRRLWNLDIAHWEQRYLHHPDDVEQHIAYYCMHRAIELRDQEIAQVYEPTLEIDYPNYANIRGWFD